MSTIGELGSFFEKRAPVTPQSAGTLSSAELPPGGLRQKVAGMQREKQLIERRLVLPLAQAPPPSTEWNCHGR
ncbi:hypothetical protein ACN6LA_001940 [Streptomyces sp. SAS_269]|uniref:hypothetical protein n=1 Tax=Streptomyces sp. SAS_269 TaxID=3412749 RepID=UPI00403CA8B0